MYRRFARARLATSFVPMALLVAACSSAPGASESVGSSHDALLATSRVVNATTGDFNGDGEADYADDSVTTGQFWVHLNAWNGTFLASNYETVQRSVSGANWDTFVGDFNGDGLVDYADHAQDSGQFWIHLNQRPAAGQSTGSFSAANYAAAGAPSGTTRAGSGWEVLVADFTGDGWCDYADHDLATGNVWVHANLHNGTFGATVWNPTSSGQPVAATTSTAGWDVLVGDFNGDKFADYAEHQESTGAFNVYVNAKNGTFSRSIFAQGKTAIGSQWEVLVGDFNNDGYADFADHALDSGQFWVHLNQRTPGVFAGVTYPVQFNAANWATGTTAHGAGWGVLGHEWHGGSGDACGDLDEPYCQGKASFSQACNPGLWFFYSNDLCVPCGAQGQPACTGWMDYSGAYGVWRGTCNPGLDILPGTTGDAAMTCEPCGAQGQPACLHSGCNAGLGAAFTTTCQPCGATGEYMCPGNVCNSGVQAYPSTGTCGYQPTQGTNSPPSTTPATSEYTFCCLPVLGSGMSKYEISASGTSESDAASKVHDACHAPGGMVGDPLPGACSNFGTTTGTACQEGASGYREKCCASTCTTIGACSDADMTTATDGFDAECAWQDGECPASCY
jgi:hypothetical protein